MTRCGSVSPVYAYISAYWTFIWFPSTKTWTMTVITTTCWLTPAVVRISPSTGLSLISSAGILYCTTLCLKKTRKLWNGIARNYKDRFWCHYFGIGTQNTPKRNSFCLDKMLEIRDFYWGESGKVILQVSITVFFGRCRKTFRAKMAQPSPLRLWI